MSALDDYDRLAEMLTANSTEVSLKRAAHEWLAEETAKLSPRHLKGWLVTLDRGEDSARLLPLVYSLGLRASGMNNVASPWRRDSISPCVRSREAVAFGPQKLQMTASAAAEPVLTLHRCPAESPRSRRRQHHSRRVANESKRENFHFARQCAPENLATQRCKDRHAATRSQRQERPPCASLYSISKSPLLLQRPAQGQSIDEKE